MIAWGKKLFNRLMQHEQCVNTFTLSFCVGVYIAFCPFMGFHTALVFLFSWLCGLNFAVLLAVSLLINNPWTMVPVYGLDYFLGDWTLSFLGFDHYAWNPSWVSYANEWFARSVGVSGFSFWAFMIGGNLLGIGAGLLAYPLVKTVATFMLKGRKKMAHHTSTLSASQHTAVAQSKQAVHSMATKAKSVVQQVVEQPKQYVRNAREISNTK